MCKTSIMAIQSITAIKSITAITHNSYHRHSAKGDTFTCGRSPFIHPKATLHTAKGDLLLHSSCHATSKTAAPLHGNDTRRHEGSRQQTSTKSTGKSV